MWDYKDILPLLKQAVEIAGITFVVLKWVIGPRLRVIVRDCMTKEIGDLAKLKESVDNLTQSLEVAERDHGSLTDAISELTRELHHVSERTSMELRTFEARLAVLEAMQQLLTRHLELRGGET